MKKEMTAPEALVGFYNGIQKLVGSEKRLDVTDTQEVVMSARDWHDFAADSPEACAKREDLVGKTILVVNHRGKTKNPILRFELLENF